MHLLKKKLCSHSPKCLTSLVILPSFSKLFQSSQNKNLSFAIFPSLSSNHYFSKPIVKHYMLLIFCQCKTFCMPNPNPTFAQFFFLLIMFCNKIKNKKPANVQHNCHPSPCNPKLPTHLLLNITTTTINILEHYIPCVKSHLSNLLDTCIFLIP